MIELPIRRLREDAVLPERAYAGDAGLDLAACERHELGPGERAVVGTGLEQADGPPRVLAEPRREHASGRASTGNDNVVAHVRSQSRQRV